MIPVLGLFETHLTVSDLERSIAFYGGTLGLELAHRDIARKVAFYWMGGRGETMLGLWEVGASPQRMSLHIAFKVDLSDLLDAPRRLQAANITPLDFWGKSIRRSNSAGVDARGLCVLSRSRRQSVGVSYDTF